MMSEGKKILIVEDEVLIALDIKATLEKFGFEVTEYIHFGEDVVKSIKHNKPHLILMDVKLAGDLDGVDTAKMIYENYNIPVIFVTSYSNRNILDRAKKTYPFGYIVKPFDDKELYTNIEIALFKHESEVKLKDSERKYRELAESIQQIVIECDISGKIMYLNQVGMELLGILPNKIEVGTYITDFLTPESFNSIKLRIEQVSNKNKQKYSRIHKIKGRKESILIVEEFLSPVFIHNQLVGYRGVLIDITETENLISKIRETEERFVQIANTVKESFWIVNYSSKHVQYANPSFYRIYECNENNFKVYPDDIFKLIHPEDIDVLKLNFSSCIEEGNYDVQYRILSANGNIKWIHEKITIIKNKFGKIIKLVGYASDITFEKSAELSLIKKDIDNRNLLLSIPDSILIVNKKGIICSSYLKPKEELWYKSNDPLIGKKAFKVFGLESQKLLVEKMNFCFQMREAFIHEVKIKHKQKSLWFEIRISPGQDDFIMLMVRNVTEQKNNLIELQKYFNIIEQTRELIMITDRKGFIEYVNPYFQETTGYRGEELGGKLPRVLNAGKQPKIFYKELWANLLNGKSFKGEFVNKTKDGKLFIEEKIISPIKNEKGEIINFISTGRDVTKDREKEKQIKSLEKARVNADKREQKKITLSLIQGEENERKRIAREIHDSLGQMLTVTLANLSSISRNSVKDKTDKEKLHLVSQMLSEIIQESRRISQNLSPSTLYSFGLFAVVSDFLKSINRQQKIKFFFKSNISSIRFKNEIEVNIYRVIQEAVQNVLKHSKAKTCNIDLSYLDGVLILLIKDNGKGFSINPKLDCINNCHGIKNMEERSKMIGGIFKYYTKPNMGFQLSVKLKTKPLKYD